MKTGIQYIEAIQFFLMAMVTAIASAVMLAGIVLLLSAPAQAFQQSRDTIKHAQILHSDIPIKMQGR